jgi:hypothetical protein
MKLNKIGDLISHPKLGRGVYRVVGTAMTGGGRGHNDVYPDGHELTLMEEIEGEINWKKKPKRFWQSGSFVEEKMLPYCKPKKDE